MAPLARLLILLCATAPALALSRQRKAELREEARDMFYHGYQAGGPHSFSVVSRSLLLVQV